MAKSARQRVLAHCCPWGWQCHPHGVGEGAYRWGPGAFLWGLGLEVAIGYEGLVDIEYALRAVYLPRGVVAVLVEPVQRFQPRISPALDAGSHIIYPLRLVTGAGMRSVFAYYHRVTGRAVISL